MKRRKLWLKKKQAKSKIKIVKPLKKETKKTKELLSDLNVKINNSEVSEKEKRLTLIKTHKKITNLLLKTIPYLLFLFILDVVMLSVITVLFILSAFVLDRTAANIVRYILLGVSAFMLAKFTYMNWFSKNLYFKKIIVFKYKSKVDRQKFRAVREISFTPIWFLIFFVASNFYITILVNFEIQQNFVSTGDNKVLIWAILRTTIDMMLLPSFLNSFNKIADKSKAIDANYVKLIKDQYFSNKSLFEDVEFEDNYLNLKFSKNSLTSKNGLFILVNKDDLTRPDQGRMIEINNEILDRYKEIWESYVDLLENRMKAKFNKATVHKLFWLERIYDTIFLDLFEI
ncbi:unknown transmembrane protein [Mesoplasma florum L1]|uniref:Uncharacterized protein n=1 Tax=Mesoplasma florum (strain ATCC 33453 / NBRC 100688 / NCTC 11704 / L1) TaxID=265311 RepID=Q6F1D1_MESFL|nr:hypothetical protein [Mesoplasma florum]AAT75692.1 unknown transmembrane protein [Mesoplasma florum L1]